MADSFLDWNELVIRAQLTRDLKGRIVLRARTLKLDPKTSYAYFERALELLKQGKHVKAKQKFKRSLQDSSDPQYLHDQWLAGLYSAREFEEIVLLAETNIDKFSFRTNIQNILGACFLHLGDYDNAIKYFQSATQEEKNFGMDYFNWALALYLQGKTEEAFEMSEKGYQIGGFPVRSYDRELSELKEDLKREGSKGFEDLIKKKIEGFEYLLELDRIREEKNKNSE